MKTTLGIDLIYAFLLIAIGPSYVNADDIERFHHEMWGGLSWTHEMTEYTNYVINDEPNDLKSEKFKKSPWHITTAYTYFFTPLSGSDDVPFALWEFYTRPTKVHIHLTAQSKQAATNTHRDPALSYTRETTTDERIRTLGIEFEHYFLSDTGFFIHTSTLRNNDGIRNSYTSPQSAIYGTGQHEGLRWTYGAGISRYFSDHIRVITGYSRLSGEFRHRDNTWTAVDPQLVTHYYFDSEPTGYTFFVTGEYVVMPSIALKGTYELQAYTERADFLSVPPKDLAGQSMLHDDDMIQHGAEASISFYRGNNMTLELGTTYRTTTIERRYTDNTQAVDHDYYTIGIVVGTLYYFMPAFGVHLQYELLHQLGDVRIWYPENESSQTTYDTNRHRHALTIKMVGRF